MSAEELIESGLLEAYVLGVTNACENLFIQSYLSIPNISDTIAELETALIRLAKENAIPAPPILLLDWTCNTSLVKV